MWATINCLRKNLLSSKYVKLTLKTGIDLQIHKEISSKQRIIVYYMSSLNRNF